MHINIEITKEAIAAVVWLVLGISCFVYGIGTYFKVEHAIPLEKLQVQNCAEGQVVIGEIKSYLNKNIQPTGKPYYSGVSQTFIKGVTGFECYTVPIDEGYYIRFMVADKEINEKLKNILSGNEKSVPFEGKIIKAPLPINYPWYRGIEEVSQGKIRNIISDYVIYETPVKEKINIAYGGILFLGVFLIQYKIMGGMKKIIGGVK